MYIHVTYVWITCWNLTCCVCCLFIACTSHNTACILTSNIVCTVNTIHQYTHPWYIITILFQRSCHYSQAIQAWCITVYYKCTLNHAQWRIIVNHYLGCALLHSLYPKDMPSCLNIDTNRNLKKDAYLIMIRSIKMYSLDSGEKHSLDTKLK